MSPSKDGATMADKTYYYKNPVVGDQKKLVTVAAHFKNAFRGADQNLATVDGLWQVSDAPTEVKADTQYDKMTIRTVDATQGVITMDNKDNAITLSKNKDSALMAGVKIKTADNDTLRFYIYKTITEPGEYQIRGKVATEGATWDPQNFAGFYYDIKKDIGKEQLTTVLTETNKLSGDAPYGVTYTTTAQAKDYEFEDWGSYNVIGFQAEKYFAGYITNEDAAKNIFFKESTDENSLSSEQLEKDGSVVDSKVISPSKDGATMADKTYYYKNPVVGDQKKLVTVAAHFKNAFRGADQNLATVDGLWQISSEATEVKADTQYDKMTIRSVDATNGVITMDNKDNAITLSKNKDSALMAGVNIKTADNDTLRYYIYKAVTIEGAAAANKTVEAAPVVEAAPAVENKTVEAPAAEAAPVVKNETAEKPAAEAPKTEANATKTATKPAPGFESILAITGLLAVAFLVLGRKE
ncbi:MAG: S-layer protein domain-containing protein [Methanothrix sp.]|nr:S-layer protein domain-containing protein [Methanothrix sp.]